VESAANPGADRPSSGAARADRNAMLSKVIRRRRVGFAGPGSATRAVGGVGLTQVRSARNVRIWTGSGTIN